MGILCALFYSFLYCVSLVDDACEGRRVGNMSSRSDVCAIYTMWHKLFSSIATIDSADTSAHIAEDEICLVMPFNRF